MNKKYIFWAYLTIFLQICSLGYGERTKDKMYQRIVGFNSCYRRLNATHQIGCSSKRGGSTGVIHYCETPENLDFLLNNGSAAPYIPVMPTKLFTVETVHKLIASEKVSGLVLHPNNETLTFFTHDNQCPNPQSSLAGTCDKNFIWNKQGTGLLFQDIPFPVFYVESEDEVSKMRDCFAKFNNFSYDGQADRSLCSLELKSFMFATTNSQTCRRRSNIVTNLNPIKFCDPLGDSNIWASLYPLAKGPRDDTKPAKDYKYIVIAARMDTTTMFEQTSGANSPVTGIITLLSTAKLLKSILREEDLDKAKTNVLFILFNGETYDYIGSQRLLYDMEKGYFPVNDLAEDNNVLPVIKPENISLFIELSQLGNSGGKVFAHYLKETAEISAFAQKLRNNSASVTFQDVPQSLPPASLHTFLKDNPELPGLILSDHETTYTNPFYNSIYDNASNIQFSYYNVSEGEAGDIPSDSIQRFVANVSEMVAKSVYEEIKKEVYTGDQSVDVVLVNELFYCYLEDPNCKVQKATKGLKLPKVPVSLYVGVDRVSNFATTFTSDTLGWFTGDIEGEGDANCTNKPRNYAFRYYNMSKSIYDLNVTLCYKITMNKTDAVSPAFIIPDYDWKSGQYSTWTESTWNDMGMRIFLKPSSAHERMTIALGSMSMIFSFMLVYFMKSRSHILFTPPPVTVAPTDC